MTRLLEPTPAPALYADVGPAVEAAARRIAPAWPLDRLIAVNPWWGFVERPMPEAAAEAAALAGARMLMPRAWYRAQWEAGRFTERHLREALAQAGARRPVAELVAALKGETAPPPVRPLLTDLLDARRDLGHGMSWSEFVTRHLSQACAAYFDEGQARWVPGRSAGLYGVWRSLARHDGGPRLLMGLHGFREAVDALPEEPRALIAEATAALGVAAPAREGWYTALLMTLHGWASACAFRRWEARLAHGDDDQIVHLLAARLAWELILLRTAGDPTLGSRWAAAQRDWDDAAPAAERVQRDEWVLQRAVELAYQERLVGALARPPARRLDRPSVQAVFCIDVRSEVYRRALEAADPDIHTLGFAGFFGLPIAYAPLAGPARAQLPGLLAPALLVRDAGAGVSQAAAGTRAALVREAALQELPATPGSAFSYVEAAGLAYGAALLGEGFGFRRSEGDPLRGSAASTFTPEVVSRADGTPFDLDARVDLAAGILRAMSLTEGFAPLVALIGHGAETRNNPQAAGLHCGACGGQAGEVNARAAAALLNDPDVRRGLAARGIALPATTHVVAGLHNTTTDDVVLFDRDRVPASHREALEAFDRRLAAATQRARAERAPALGLAGLSDPELERALRRRAADWSEVRPEWGLVRNASFVVAPRERTRGLDLGGRAFLHEYRWEQDAEFGVLELIMTAPMVVTNWINLQYYASMVDPHRYGSGNKVLHNVVGGRLGVFEGAGGDLRIGLALQSLHDGRDWVHEPLRLSVCIEAPRDAVEGVLTKHAMVRDLVVNEWLFLYVIAPGSGTIHQRRRDGWHEVAADQAPPRLG